MQKFGGPRIRLIAHKRVPNQFEKFTWNSAQAYSRSPSPTSASSPIRAQCEDPITQARDPVHGNQAQTRDPRAKDDLARDPIHMTRDPCAQAQAIQECNPRVLHQRPIRGSTHGSLDPVHPFPN